MKIATGTKKKKDIIVIIEKRVMLSKDSCERIKYRLCANSTKKKKKRKNSSKTQYDRPTACNCCKVLFCNNQEIKAT